MNPGSQIAGDPASFTLPLGRDSASYLWRIFEDGKATGLSVERLQSMHVDDQVEQLRAGAREEGRGRCGRCDVGDAGFSQRAPEPRIREIGDP